MKSPVSAVRVLVKAFLFFVAFNLIYALVDPPIGKINGYNLIWPGRLRFPYSETPAYYGLSHNAPVIEDFDAMFGSHIISASPKKDNEFRVLLLGDSSTWGGHVTPTDMLSEQLNRLGLTTCDGKTVQVFNLGYPWPSLLRDVLVLDWAKQYDPDLIIWLVTLHSFEKKPMDRDFLIPHADRMGELVKSYNIKLPRVYMEIPQTSLWQKTIVGQRKHIKDVLLGQVFGPMWAGTGVDNHLAITQIPPFSQDMPADISYMEYQTDKQAPVLVQSLMFDVLRAGHDIAGDVPLIVINEPIFIASGQNSDLRYNELYARWAYDAYRDALTKWIQLKGYSFLDYWNTVPAEEFNNGVFHRNPQGEERFANLIAPSLVESSCR